MMNHAYEVGMAARRKGKRRTTNPYTGGTNGWHEWFAGYDMQTATEADAKPPKRKPRADDKSGEK